MHGKSRRPARLLLSLIVAALLLVAGQRVCRADALDDIGFRALQARYGASVPYGAGVPVAHVEAIESMGYQPLTTIPEFLGKSFTIRSNVLPPSQHGTDVATRFYGNSSSAAPGVSTIEVYNADDWLNEGFLRTGEGSSDPRPSFQTSRVSNHSWISGKTDSTNVNLDVLQRTDWVIAQDDYVHVVGVSNGTDNTNPMLSNAMNAIAVGVTHGNHAVGTVGLAGIYQAGRTKPDLVAPLQATSFSTPTVAAAAATLIGAAQANPAFSNGAFYASPRTGQNIYHGESSEVIKALLLAGADRSVYNSDGSAILDYRAAPANQAANGLDVRFGAGQVNVYHSYQMLAAGEQASLQDGGPASVSAAGFDLDRGFGSQAGTNTKGSYEFTAGWTGQTLTASLVWNANINMTRVRAGLYSTAGTLYNLNLSLVDITDGGNGVLAAASQSTNQNTENIHTSLIGGRRYRLEVAPGAGQTPFNWDYGLAWSTINTIGWTGGTSSVWDSQGAANWIKGNSPSTFVNGEHVVFNDSASNPTVQIVGVQKPASVQFNNNALEYTVSGDGIAGATGLVKTGTGTLILANSNTYSGGTWIRAGTLQLGGSAALPVNTKLQLDSPGTFDLAGYSQSVRSLNGNGGVTLGSNELGGGQLTIGTEDGSSLFSGIISGVGGVQKTGTGSATVGNSNSYLGPTTIAGGQWIARANNSLGLETSGTSVAAGAALVLENSVNYATPEALLLAGAGATGQGALESRSGDNVFAGPIQIASSATIGVISGTLRLSGPLSVTAGAAAAKGGAGPLTLAGGWDLANGASVAINSGVVAIAPVAGSTVTLGTVPPTISIASGATVSVNPALRDPLSDTLQPARRVNVVNQAANGLTIGAGNARAGAIDGTGSTVLSPGAALAAWRVRQSQLTIGPGSSVVIEPNGGEVGLSVLSSTQSPSLVLQGNALFDLNDNDLVRYYEPGTGEATLAAIRQQILDGFAGEGLKPRITSSSALADGDKILVAFDNSLVQLTDYEGLPLTGFNQIIVRHTFFGDLNLDGLVDAADYLVVDNNFGTGTTILTGDANLDGLVDAADYVIIDNNYSKGVVVPVSAGLADSVGLAISAGQGAGASRAAVAVVPEPSAWVLAAVGCVVVALMLWRRRRGLAGSRGMGGS